MLSSPTIFFRRFIQASGKVAVPAVLIIGIFLLAGVFSGSPVVARFLGAYTGSITSVVHVTTELGPILCEGGVSTRPVVVSTNPSGVVNMIRVTSLRGGFAKYVAPGQKFFVPATSDGIEYEVFVISNNASVIIDPPKSVFAAKGVCPLENIFHDSSSVNGTLIQQNSNESSLGSDVSPYSSVTNSVVATGVSTATPTGTTINQPTGVSVLGGDGVLSTSDSNSTAGTGDNTVKIDNGGVVVPGTAGAATNTVITESKVDTSIPPLELPLGATEPMNVRVGVFPIVIKNDARVYSDVSGTVTFGVEVPGSQVRILLGDTNRWRPDLVLGAEQGLIRIGGTSRWRVDFNTEKIPDGDWRLRAAFIYNGSWHFTESFGFNIKNVRVIPTDKPSIAVATPTPVTVQQPQVQPPLPLAQKTEQQQRFDAVQSNVKTATLTNGIKLVQKKREKPGVRLVVNDRVITSESPTFDQEEVEVRVALTNPADRVQLVVYSPTGAMMPKVRDVGPAMRDDLLSRNGTEVWTRLVDMTTLSTGSYQIFAHVYYARDEKGIDTHPRSISVQHISRPQEVPGFASDGSTDEIASNVRAETREEILRRVTDPSACVSQEECAVFCSSTGASRGKCAEYARMAVKIVKEEKEEARKVQEEAKRELGGELKFKAPGEVVVTVISDRKADPSTDATSTSAQASNTITKEWHALEPSVRPSLADVIPRDALLHLVEKNSQLSVELPSEVNTVTALQSYCGTSEHIEKCSRVIERLVPDAHKILAARAEEVKKSDEDILHVFEQRTGARAYIDGDNDGISDYDEINIYRTDPEKRDTFGSGFSDGAALLGGNNPSQVIVQSTSSAMLVLGPNSAIENPKVTGATQKNLLSVTHITPLETGKNANGGDEVKKMIIKGKAPANSFVRVFLFSDPIVVTVKADENGDWSYVLDKTLPDGSHTAYTAIADASGKILAKSEALPFVKRASAISVGEAAVVNAPTQRGIIPSFSPLSIFALIIAMLGIALSVIGVVIGLRKTAP